MQSFLPASITFISDPLFYLVAIPGALLIGISKSGLSGFGALAVPLIALTMPVPHAAAILMPVLFLADVMGAKALFIERDKALTKLLLPAGLLGTLLGTFLFGVLSASTVAAVLGALTLLFLAQRMLFPPRVDSKPAPRWLGFLLGTASGFASFVAHAGSPPINAYLLPLKLPPLRYTGTMATFFLVVNFSKWVPYAFLGLIDWQNMATGVLLLPFAALGVVLGIFLMRRMDPKVFYALVHIGMFLTGSKLLWDGIK
ncbi:sulfite exporter TauE/SafE family protein [soil metagenome]